MNMYVGLVQYTQCYFSLFFLIIIGINSAFIYFYWYLKKSNTGVININAGTGTVIYETYEWEV